MAALQGLVREASGMKIRSSESALRFFSVNYHFHIIDIHRLLRSIRYTIHKLIDT